jgi:phosphatidylinositol alpha 1,6-mannosyltransferase
LASGVPVISAAAGGPLDLVRHRDNGWLWSGRDPAVLAAQVAGLRENRIELTGVAQRTRSSVVGRNWSRLGDELLGHYRDVLMARSAERRPRGGAGATPIRAAKRAS